MSKIYKIINNIMIKFMSVKLIQLLKDDLNSTVQIALDVMKKIVLYIEQ